MNKPFLPRQLARYSRNIPLSWVLVVPFVVEVMAAVGLTGYFVYRNGQEAIRDLANRLMNEASDRIELSIQQQLSIPIQMTNHNASAIRAGLLDWQDPLAVERYWSAQLREIDNQQALLGTFLVTRPLQDTAVITKRPNLSQFVVPSAAPVAPQSQPTADAIAEALQALAPTASLPPTDPAPSAITIWGNGKLPERAFFAAHSEPWLKQPAVSGEWYIAPLQTRDRPALTAVYVRPFYDPRDRPQGVLGASIALSAVNQALEATNISPHGQAFIVDSQGFLVASSVGDLLFRSQPGPTNAPKVPAPNQALQRIKATQSKDTITRHTAEYLNRNENSWQAFHHKTPLRFSLRGKEYFVHVRPWRTPQDLDWWLVLAVPEADFSAQIDRNYESMLMLSLVSLVGTIAIALLTARQIVRPILRLSRASQDLMLGKLDGPIDEDSPITEISMLAYSFNEMSEHLQASFDQVSLALQESTEKFTTAFRTSPDPILITSFPDGVHLEVNESFLRLTGLTKAEVIGKSAVEVGLWERLEDRETFMHLINTYGRASNQEISTRLRSGQRLTVLVSSEIIELEGKQCLLTIAKDITERKQLEEALRQSETTLRHITDALPVFIAYLDPQQRYQFVNKTYEERFGRPREWFYGQHIRSILGEVAYRGIAQHIDHALQGNFVTYTVEQPDPTGAVRYLEVTLQPDFGPAGQINGCHSLEIDVTQRRHAEEELRLSEERFRTAFDTAAVGMTLASPGRGQFIKVNPAFCRMMGYEEAEILQLTYRDLTHPDDLEYDQDITRQLYGNQIPYCHFEKRFIHKSGRVIWTLISVSLVRNANHQPLFTVSSVQDISVRKEAEKVLW